VHVDETSGTMTIEVQTIDGALLARCQSIVLFLN